MKTVDEVTLGFRAFDVHELLLHFIAERLGYYREAGLKVGLRDLTFVTDYREHSLSVACGSALVARAKGVMQKVVFVGTDCPMFWLYARHEIDDVGQLRNARIATFPPQSPPWYMLPIVLRKKGIDPEKTELLSVRDDVARLGLLRSGNVDAAVISSAFPPARLEDIGLTPLVFFGDQLRIPTTGLTASDEMMSTQSDLLRRLTGALARSLRAVRECPEEVVKVVAYVLGESSGTIAQKTFSLITPYYAGDGRGGPESLHKAMDFANVELSPAQPLKQEDLYDFRFV